jgi:endoglucanase
MNKKKILLSVLLISLISIGLYFYSTRITKWQNLQNMWTIYKKRYIDQSSGRTIDEQRNGVTTSEGQSYTMLQSLWLGDKEQFQQSWMWTKYNLQRKEDKLFSWEWGKKKDGQYGILTETGGENVAVDADIDIAYSLVKASQKWNNPEYLAEARSIIQDIWNTTVIQISNGKFVLASNNLEKKYNKSKIIVNPSYFTPHAFRLFTTVTPELEWKRLAEDCYYLLDQISQFKIDNKQVFLPPDWIQVDTKNMQISLLSDRPWNYSYDAVRIPWRIGMDYYYHKSPEAMSYLRRFDFLGEEWKKKNQIYPSYTGLGEIIHNTESTLGYSTSLAYFSTHNPSIADTIYKNKLEPEMFKSKSYYESNWMFFSLILYYKLI